VELFCTYSLLFKDATPGYSFGVRANLKKSFCHGALNHHCESLQKSIESQFLSQKFLTHRFLRHLAKHYPDQYVFEAGDQRGAITQFQKEGRVSFLAGVNGMGPSQETMETMQVFNARIAKHVAEACHARFLDDPHFYAHLIGSLSRSTSQLNRSRRTRTPCLQGSAPIDHGMAFNVSSNDISCLQWFMIGVPVNFSGIDHPLLSQYTFQRLCGHCY
jgi:hypothetical protein